MIGTFTFAVMATMATPCEGLKAISLPNTTITTAELVPKASIHRPTPPRGTAAAPAAQRHKAAGGVSGTTGHAEPRRAATPAGNPSSRRLIAKLSRS